MSTRHLLSLVLLCSTAVPVFAYPPAPFHRVYGTVRDESGDPLETGVGTIVLSGSGGGEITRCTSDGAIGPQINYSLSVPMDSGTTAQLYTVSALRPMLPFTIRVVINNVPYVPIEMTGTTWKIGDPSGATRLDLTLGVDSDGDGLPDAWEWALIDDDPTGRLKTLADVNPDDDLDGDGLTNLQENIAGTYAIDGQDGLNVKLVDKVGNVAHIEFLAIRKRTYHFMSSADGVSWAPQPMSLAPSGGSAKSHFYSDDVRIAHVYLPVENPERTFFRLYVE